MARDGRQLIDAGLGKTELVGAFRQVERSNAVGSFLVSEILSTVVMRDFVLASVYYIVYDFSPSFNFDFLSTSRDWRERASPI